MKIPYEEYHRTHRMPRVLMAFTLNEKFQGIIPIKDLLVNELNCSCMKFVSKGAAYVHYTNPREYRGDELANIAEVWHKAIDDGAPYDIIITDEIVTYDAVTEWSETQVPKPLVMFCNMFMQTKDLQTLFDDKIIAFNGEALIPMPGKGNTRFYDVIVERFLGTERFECEAKASVRLTWAGSKPPDKEVMPDHAELKREAIRIETTRGGR